MLYRVTNKRQGPIQLALHSANNKKTQLIVLPWKQSFDIPEEMYSEQIDELAKRGDVIVKKITKKSDM